MGELLIEVRPNAANIRPGDLETEALLRSGASGRASAAAVESFEARAPEIADALRKVAEAMRSRLDEAEGAPTEQGWGLNSVEIALELSLEAEAGVVITKASAGATLSATLTWTRQGNSSN